MAKSMHELLWRLREDTASEISELEQSDSIDAWLDEQSQPTAAYAKDVASVVHRMEQELSCRGLSLKLH